MKRYKDYYWKDGVPRGLSPLREGVEGDQVNYKIIADPYGKWISIEKYLGEILEKVLYDSKIFDFRSLKPALQTAWEKITLIRETAFMRSLIRNQDDRTILVEDYFFEEERCRACVTRSPHGLLISEQFMYYKDCGDRFNGVALFDTESRIVMYKRYAIDEDGVTFTELLEENWDMEREKESGWTKWTGMDTLDKMDRNGPQNRWRSISAFQFNGEGG